LTIHVRGMGRKVAGWRKKVFRKKLPWRGGLVGSTLGRGGSVYPRWRRGEINQEKCLLFAVL